MNKELEISNQTLIAAVLMLVIGAGIGYFSYAALNAPIVSNSTTMCSVAGATGPFTPDMKKINDIGSLLQDVVYLQTGENHTVQYVKYTLQDELVVLDYTIDGAYPQEIYTTKDLKYIVQQPTAVDTFRAQIDSAKAQMEAKLKKASEPAPKSDKPEVLLFVMSFCPYGNVAENAMVDVVSLLGDNISFEPVYILSGANGNYQSLHGTNELNQDVREKIIFKKYGAKKWMEYVYDVNNNCTLNNVETCWKDAAQRHDINVSYVEEEYAKNFNAIADAEVAKTNQYGVQGSPTLIMNGKEYSGARSSEAFKTFICSGFSVQPEKCNTTLSTQQGVSTGSCG